MQPGFQVLYCICKLPINGIARYYVSGEETSIDLNMLVNQSNRVVLVMESAPSKRLGVLQMSKYAI